MAMHRKNKAPAFRANHLAEPWFAAHKKRSRMRDKMAKLSRRRNRGR
jgi:hypothetical protein